MSRTSRIGELKEQVVSLFEQLPQKVFSEADLRRILELRRIPWRLPDYFNAPDFIQFLMKERRLVRQAFESKDYGHRIVYAWGEVTDYQLAVAIKPGAYLSHWTAAFLHGLTGQVPVTIYVNKEQSEKPRASGQISQEAIDRAFSNAPRVSNYAFEFRKRRVCLLSGKHTGNLEVGELTGPSREALPVTKIERTLIDMAVRPQYSGGVYEVLSAYKAARDRASSNVILATLMRLKYAYPYHQAIGFYMERAGYPGSVLELLRGLGMTCDFYLTHRIAEKEYVKEWRLFVPKGIEAAD